MHTAPASRKKLWRNASIELLRAPSGPTLNPYRPRNTARRGVHLSWKCLSTANHTRSVVGPRLRRTALAKSISAQIAPDAKWRCLSMCLYPGRVAWRRTGTVTAQPVLRDHVPPRRVFRVAWHRRCYHLRSENVPARSLPVSPRLTDSLRAPSARPSCARREDRRRAQDRILRPPEASSRVRGG